MIRHAFAAVAATAAVMTLSAAGASAGTIDVDGQFDIEYRNSDRVIAVDGRSATVDGPVDIVFPGGFFMSFDDAMLELERDADNDWALAGARVNGGFSSDIGPFEHFDMLLDAGGLDVILGYGGYDLIEDLETPLNPDNHTTYLFLSVQVGESLDLADGLELQSKGGEVTVVVDPGTPTVYAYARFGDLFPPVMPITPDSVGFGLSANSNTFMLQTWANPFGSLPWMHTGNTWLEGALNVGFGNWLGLYISAEGLIDANWDAIGGGGTVLENLAVNGNVDGQIGLPVASLAIDMGTATAWYGQEESTEWQMVNVNGIMMPRPVTTTTDVFVMAGQTDLPELLGGTPLSPFAANIDAAAEVRVDDGDFQYLVANAEIDFGASNHGAVAEAELNVTEQMIIGSGTLDFGVTDVDVTVTGFGNGFSISGAATARAVVAGYGIKGRLTVTGGTGGLSLDAEANVKIAGHYTGWFGLGVDINHRGRIQVCSQGYCATF